MLPRADKYYPTGERPHVVASLCSALAAQLLFQLIRALLKPKQ